MSAALSAASEPLASLVGQRASATLTPKPRLASRTGGAEHPGDRRHHKGVLPLLEPPCPTCSSRPAHRQQHSGLWACRGTTLAMASLPKPPHNGPCEHGPCTSKAHSLLLSSSLRPSVLLPAPGGAGTPRLPHAYAGDRQCRHPAPAPNEQLTFNPFDSRDPHFQGGMSGKLDGRTGKGLQPLHASVCKGSPSLHGTVLLPMGSSRLSSPSSSRTAELAACQDRLHQPQTAGGLGKPPDSTWQHGMGL